MFLIYQFFFLTCFLHEINTCQLQVRLIQRIFTYFLLEIFRQYFFDLNTCFLSFCRMETDCVYTKKRQGSQMLTYLVQIHLLHLTLRLLWIRRNLHLYGLQFQNPDADSLLFQLFLHFLCSFFLLKQMHLVIVIHFLTLCIGHVGQDRNECICLFQVIYRIHRSLLLLISVFVNIDCHVCSPLYSLYTRAIITSSSSELFSIPWL